MLSNMHKVVGGGGVRSVLAHCVSGKKKRKKKTGRQLLENSQVNGTEEGKKWALMH